MIDRIPEQNACPVPHSPTLLQHVPVGQDPEPGPQTALRFRGPSMDGE